MCRSDVSTDVTQQLKDGKTFISLDVKDLIYSHAKNIMFVLIRMCDLSIRFEPKCNNIKHRLYCVDNN